MTLIADALDDDGNGWDGIDAFVARHPALVERNAVASRYDAITLQSERARRRLCLPAR